MLNIDRMYAMIELVRVGSKVRSVREWLGLSCKEFAEEIGVSPKEVIRVESGQQFASDAFLAKICRKYHGLTIAKFIEDAPIDWCEVF